MSRMYRVHYFVFDWLLSLQSDDLIATYGDEVRSVFRDRLQDARKEGASAILSVWSGVIAETIVLAMPRTLSRLRLALAATGLASVLTVGSALGFCTLKDSPAVHACTREQAGSQEPAQGKSEGGLIKLPNGQHMFLECSGDPTTAPTVILATGRGLGTADSWKRVEQNLAPSIGVCSYDALGAGKSDHVQGNPQSRPVDQVVADMDGLFRAAGLTHPYLLVGVSAGGILIRRYQQQHPDEVAGLVFVDSSHEEMQWRDAAIAPQFDPDWNNPSSLRDNGMLPDQQKLTWRADIPLIVLERAEKVPQSAFPNLTPQQVDGINAAWHDFQVDLASRSKYGQLRVVPNSGHRMQEERPDAIAGAIQEVVHQVKAKTR